MRTTKGLEKLRFIIIWNAVYILTVEGTSITKRQTSSQSQYYLAYCPIRQGNYITYSSSLCYCRRGGQQYDCRPAGNTSASTATQRPPARPAQAGALPPLRPPPVAPPPPPPPNRPSTPLNVDTRPGVFRQLFPSG